VKRYNLIVKMIPDSGNPETRERVIRAGLDKFEILAYQQPLREMVKEVLELRKYICDLHFAGIQEEDTEKGLPYASVLVLEDLKPQGYTTPLYSKSLTKDQFDQGLHFLATLHCASKSLERKHGSKLPEIYPWLRNLSVPIQDGRPPPFVSFLPFGFANLYDFLEENGRSSQIAIFKKLEPGVAMMMKALLYEPKSKHSLALCHMDLWSHNILVHTQKPIKVIDWQASKYTQPLYDLAGYMAMTLPLDFLNGEGISAALHAYFNKYAQLCGASEVLIDRNWTETQKFFSSRALPFGLLWFVLCFESSRNVPGSKTRLLKTIDFFLALEVPGTLESLLMTS
jgi:hypothetical protein